METRFMEMIAISEKILASRELRYRKMQFLKKDFKSVITVKTNIPGRKKNLKLSYTITKLFRNLIPKSYISKLMFFDDFDGPYYIIGSNYEAEGIKRALMSIEDNHFLGRFIDLDVYDGEQTLSRQVPRKCYLCDNIAFNCIREKRHSQEDLISFFENKTLEYFENEVFRIIDESILLELNLHPKFGLVTPNTKGSHKDMNYYIMTSAKDVIIPYLVKMFTVGWKSKLIEVFSKIRVIGLKYVGVYIERLRYEGKNLWPICI